MKQLKQESLNLSDEELQQSAQRMAQEMVDIIGLGRGAAVSILIAEILLITILHMQTPMPEVNITAVRQVLDHLRKEVFAHNACAKHIGACQTPPRVM